MMGSINTSEDLNNTWSVDADALYENSAKRKLRYYYPTIENESDNYAYMIAPKIRVASSYGKTYTINRTNCRRRACVLSRARMSCWQMEIADAW